MPKTDSAKQEKRRHHIAEMREKLERFFGKPSSQILQPDDNSEFEERFLEHIIAMEGVDEVSLFDTLVNGGISLPPAKDLDDVQLTAKLWEVIRGMALLGHYLYHTDHLSDRQLYEHLWTDTLPEPTSIVPDNPNFACHIDLLGGWSAEDMQIYLKYYADEEARQHWSGDWPEDALPAHEDPQYDRDRHLPEAPFDPMKEHECS